MKFLHNVILENLNKVDMIIEEGVDVNFKFDINLMRFYFRYLKSQPIRFERKLVRRRISIDILDSPLHLAAALGIEYLCRKLLDKGADINATNVNEITPLQKAINTNNFQIFRYLVNSGADCNLPDHWGRTPLMNASKICDANFLKYLLKSREVASFLIKSGADVNEKDIWGDAPLSMTIENKSNGIAKMLIQAGASINAKNKNCETALYKASHTLKPVIIHILLDDGADANIKNTNEISPLNSAAFKIMKAHDISVNIVIKRLFRYSTHFNLFEFLKYFQIWNRSLENIPFVKLMISYYVLWRPTYSFPENSQLPNNLIEWMNSCKSQFAIMKNHLLGILKDFIISRINLLKKNTNQTFQSFFPYDIPNYFRPNYYNSQFITDHGNFRFFLKKIQAVQDSTCFCGLGEQTSIHLLLECPVFQDYRVNNGLIALGPSDLISRADCNLHDRWGRTPLMNASKICDANFLKYLLKVKVELEASSQNALTAIFYPIKSNKFLNFKLLLEAGADMGKKYVSKRTLLHHACLYESREVASFLIKSGADVNEKDKWGDAPLSMTIENKSNEIAKMIIQSGASINAKNKNCETALYKASCTLKLVIIHLLLDAGAGANIKNTNEISPLNSAIYEIITSISAHDISVNILLLRYSTHFDLFEFLRYFSIWIRSFENIPFVKLIISYFVLWRPTYSLPENIQLPNNLIEWMNSCKSQVAIMENHLLGKSNITLLSFLLENDQIRLAGYLSNESTGLRENMEFNMPFVVHILIICYHRMCVSSQNMPRRSRPLIGRNTAASRRYRNARAIETPLQSETRRALRRLRYSEARVAATQTMQVPVQRIQLWTHKPFSGLQYNAHIDYKADSSVDIGQMSRVCQFCSALRFRDEPFGLCCKKGRVSLPAIESPPEPIFSLLSGLHPLSKSFLLHIRRYNSIFQMTSFGARQVVEQGYMPTFKVQGQVYHVIGSLLPEPDSEHKFLQIYFIDNYESQVTARCNMTANLNRDLVRSLQDLLHAHNHYIQSFKANLETLPQNHADYRAIIHSDKLPPEEHERRYNAPMTNEVALLMVGQEFGPRDIVLHCRNNLTQRISEIHQAYDPLQYPLIFCRGEVGYSVSLPQVNPSTREICIMQKTVSALHLGLASVLCSQ
ncbi:hypothetical protein LAZ67_9003273 [Cordylochernes scorpioides]|uniref:Uncharacterized protein n=1 Tax=Cordylochernes scorpioides TaxID=51811 RepID=A0ABY6KY43_9ARAC|nr:hypothetical protein LAZ67_9003273 [Cordylochernes scorpioides]